MTGKQQHLYLYHLLSVLLGRFVVDPQAAVDDLMPWAEEFRFAFGSSDVEH